MYKTEECVWLWIVDCFECDLIVWWEIEFGLSSFWSSSAFQGGFFFSFFLSSFSEHRTVSGHRCSLDCSLSELLTNLQEIEFGLLSFGVSCSFRVKLFSSSFSEHLTVYGHKIHLDWWWCRASCPRMSGWHIRDKLTNACAWSIVALRPQKL